MSVDIVEVSSARALRQFVDLPWRIYEPARHPQWVPPLRIAVNDALSRKNPFYRDADRQLFLAVRNGTAVGRIAAIENRAHNRFHNDRVGFFGFFECRDDAEAATSLFSAAEDWLRSRGLDTMRGPMNPSTNHECGLLVDGFDKHPMIMTTWNPPHYASLLEGAGFAKAKDLLGYYLPFTGADDFHFPERYRQVALRALRGRRIVFRDLDPARFRREVDRCCNIYNASWRGNWGFVPMALEVFRHEAKVLKYILIPEYTCIAEVDGEPAGFMINVPDYHVAYKAIGTGRLLPTGLLHIFAAKKKWVPARVMLLGVKPEFRTLGLFPLFVDEMVRRARSFGMPGVEVSWVLEDNERLNGPLRTAGARVYRRWRIYDRPIAHGAAA